MNNIFHIFIIAVFSRKLWVAFSAAAVYKIFKMLYGVNKLLSTYQFLVHFILNLLNEIYIFINFFNTNIENVFMVLIAYHYYSFEANDFSNVIVGLYSASVFSTKTLFGAMYHVNEAFQSCCHMLLHKYCFSLFCGKRNSRKFIIRKYNKMYK